MWTHVQQDSGDWVIGDCRPLWAKLESAFGVAAAHHCPAADRPLDLRMPRDRAYREGKGLPQKQAPRAVYWDVDS
jgi:hypothetical protein